MVFVGAVNNVLTWLSGLGLGNMSLKIVLITISCHVLVGSLTAYAQICESRTHERLNKCDNSSSSDWTVFEQCYNDAFNQIFKCLDSKRASGKSQNSLPGSTQKTQTGSRTAKRRSKKGASTYFEVAEKLVEQQATAGARNSRFSTRIADELVTLIFMMCNSWLKRQLQVCSRKAKLISHEYCCREASMMNCMLEKGHSNADLSHKCNSLAKGPRPAVEGEVVNKAIEIFTDGMKPFIDCYDSRPKCNNRPRPKPRQKSAAREKYQVVVDQLNADSIVKCNDLRSKGMSKCGPMPAQQKSQLNCCTIRTITSCLRELPELENCMKILMRPFPNVAKNVEEARSLRLVKEAMRNFMFCQNIAGNCEKFEVTVTEPSFNEPWSNEETLWLDVSPTTSDPSVLNSRAETDRKTDEPQDPVGRRKSWPGAAAHAPYENPWPTSCDKVNLTELKKCIGTTTRSKPKTDADCCSIKNITDCLEGVPKLKPCLDSLQMNKGLTPETVDIKGVNLNDFLFCSNKQLVCKKPQEQTDVASVERIEYCNKLRLKETPKCERKISTNFDPRSHCCTIKAVTKCLSEKPGLQSCMKSLLNLPSSYWANTPGAQNLKVISESMSLLVECDKSSEKCETRQNNTAADNNKNVDQRGSPARDMNDSDQIEKYAEEDSRPITSYGTHSAEIIDEDQRYAISKDKSYKPGGRSRGRMPISTYFGYRQLQYCGEVSVVEVTKCTRIMPKVVPKTNLDCCAVKSVTDCMHSVPKLARCLDSVQNMEDKVNHVMSLKILYKLIADYLPCWKTQQQCEGSVKKDQWGSPRGKVDRVEYCNKMRLKETPKCLKARLQVFPSESHCCTIKSVTRCLSENFGLQSCLYLLFNLPDYPANTTEGQRLNAIKATVRLAVKCERSDEECPEIENNDSGDDPVDVGSMVNDLYRKGEAGKKRMRPKSRPVTEFTTLATVVDDLELEQTAVREKYVPQTVRPTQRTPNEVAQELDVKNALPGRDMDGGKLNDPCRLVHSDDFKKCVVNEYRFMPETDTDCCRIRNFTRCINGLPRVRQCLDKLESHADYFEIDKASELHLSSLKALLPDFFFCWKKRPECEKDKVVSNRKTEAKWTEQSSWTATINMLEHCNRLRLRETPYCERPGSYALNIDCCTVKAVTQCLSNRAGLEGCMRMLLNPPQSEEETPEGQRLLVVKQSMRTILECQRRSEQCPRSVDDGVETNVDSGQNGLDEQRFEDDIQNTEGFVRPTRPREEVANGHKFVMNSQGAGRASTVNGREVPSAGVKCKAFTATAVMILVHLLL